MNPAIWKAVKMLLRSVVVWGGEESHPDCKACLAMMSVLTPMQQPHSAASILLARLEAAETATMPSHGGNH